MTYSTDTLEAIFLSEGGKRIGTTNYLVHWLLTDSRSLRSPEETMFFALVSAVGDGHRYISQLYQRGVRVFVISKQVDPVQPDAVYFLVSDTLAALQHLATYHRERFSIPVVGVAGSNGKTTVKEWLFQMLSPDFVVTRSPRSYNSQVGVPLSVWNLSSSTEVAIFEAAISQPGEMTALERILRPTIGVFTCLGDAHQENFTSLEQKCREKLQLFRHSDVLVWAEGNPVVDTCIRSFGFSGRLVPVRVGGATPSSLDVNRLLCSAVCRELGLAEEKIQHRSAQLQPVAMRLEVKQGLRGCTLINDSYNSDLASLDIALDFMQRRPGEEQLPHTLILSDIQQTGFDSETLYSLVASLVTSRGVSTFIGVGPELSRCASLFSSPGLQCYFFSSTEALLLSPVFASLNSQVILVKGARAFHFESLVSRLEQRVHETVLEVDLSALVANLRFYRSFLRPDTRIVCMVKAGAYGAGSLEVSRVLQDNGVDYLAVAVADEGVELRRAGISAGIMVMNPEMSSLRLLFRYGLEPEVYSFRILDALIEAAEREGVTAFPIHIKLDTGMHRLGFDPETDMSVLAERLSRQHALLPRSVFSHFVGSDSLEFDSFSARQYQLFTLGADSLQEVYPEHHILRHICNTAGIEHFPERQMDMVRLGLGLYGVNGITNQIINNVSTLRTTILQIRSVPAGDTVGYSRKWTAQHPSRIATLPIGYADGLDRRLGNGAAYCLVGGQKAPYVGNICMDVCMIDVTEIPCQEGDTAVIFGRDLPVTVLSDILGTIPYEILTSVSARVKKIYFRS